MRTFLQVIFHILVILILTVITQVGGFIYLVARVVSRKFKLGILRTSMVFLTLYFIATFALIPIVAPLFGRTGLPLTGNLKPLNFMTVVLNRHYVKPSLKTQIIAIAKRMNADFTGTKINYLDANFPFFDGFPLFPHLSHNDGKKLDLAFLYINTENGKRLETTPSFIGYGIYDAPINAETNYPNICKNRGYWQYGALTKLIPKWSEDKYKVDVGRTKALIELLANDKATSKIFIEPHLKFRWKLGKYDNIRFHGCQAVRHDDHIHTQIR